MAAKHVKQRSPETCPNIFAKSTSVQKFSQTFKVRKTTLILPLNIRQWVIFTAVNNCRGFFSTQKRSKFSSIPPRWFSLLPLIRCGLFFFHQIKTHLQIILPASPTQMHSLIKRNYFSCFHLNPPSPLWANNFSKSHIPATLSCFAQVC